MIIIIIIIIILIAKISCRLSFIKNPTGQSLQEIGRRILAEMCPKGQNPARSCHARQNPADCPL